MFPNVIAPDRAAHQRKQKSARKKLHRIRPTNQTSIIVSLFHARHQVLRLCSTWLSPRRPPSELLIMLYCSSNQRNSTISHPSAQIFCTSPCSIANINLIGGRTECCEDGAQRRGERSSSSMRTGGRRQRLSWRWWRQIEKDDNYIYATHTRLPNACAAHLRTARGIFPINGRIFDQRKPDEFEPVEKSVATKRGPKGSSELKERDAIANFYASIGAFLPSQIFSFRSRSVRYSEIKLMHIFESLSFSLSFSVAAFPRFPVRAVSANFRTDQCNKLSDTNIATCYLGWSNLCVLSNGFHVSLWRETAIVRCSDRLKLMPWILMIKSISVTVVKIIVCLLLIWHSSASLPFWLSAAVCAVNVLSYTATYKFVDPLD